MNCNCLIPSCCCNSCSRLVTVTSAVITTNQLVLTIPAGTYNNGENVCLLLATTLPTSAIPIPVVIKVGTSTTNIPLLNKCGGYVYNTQLRSRRIYPTKFRSDSNLFIYSGKCNLPKACVCPPPLVVSTPVATSSQKVGEANV